MDKLFILAILIYITLSSNAQSRLNQDRSALISSLQKNITDSSRVELLLDLSKHYYFERDDNTGTLDSMLQYLQKAEQICAVRPSLHWQQREIYCYLGKYFYKTGSIDQSNNYSKKIIESIQNLNTPDDQLIAWDALGFSIKALDTAGFTRIDCFKEMLSIHRQLKNKEHETGVQKLIADTYLKQGKLDHAEIELLEVLANYKKINFLNLHHTYYLLSVTNNLKGNFNKALEYGLLAIESMEKTKDRVAAITFYSNLAHLHDELGQSIKSIEYYQAIFKLEPPKPINYYYVREAGLFVRAFLNTNRKEEAGSFLFDFAKKHPPADNLGKASLARTFAYYYRSVNNNSLADKYIQDMIKLEPLLGRNNEIRRDVEYDIAQFYYAKYQYQKAAFHFELALSEAILNNSANTIKDIHLMLFKTDSSLGNYIPAFRHINQFLQLHDSIFNETKSKQIEEVQAKYETEKKEKNIKLLEKEKSLQQSKLLQASYTRNWILLGTALLMIIVGLLIGNIRIKKRTNKNQKMQQMEIEKQIGILRHLVNEKEWLLKEIHHRVKNNLQLVMSLLNSQSAYIDNDAALTAIHDSQHRVYAMSLIHQKLYNTDNVSLIDMSSYIREMTSYLADSFKTGQRIRFQHNIEQLEMDVSQAIPLGLILNEAITNSIKYAFPDNKDGLIKISLSSTAPNHYLLDISDNGIGLPKQFTGKKPGSLGMSLMIGLSEDLDGIFSMENNNGTEIRVSFVHDQNIRRPDNYISSFVSMN